MTYIVIYGDELYHHGIKGQKWGVRRFQNSDGSLKPDGDKESLRSKATKFVKKRKENLKNYSNYRKVYREASEKFNLEELRDNKIRESHANEAINRMASEISNTDYRYYQDFKPIGEDHANKYAVEARKATRYVNKKFAEQYGDEKLKQAKKTEAFIEGAEVAAFIIGAIGLSAYSALKK